MRIRDRFHISTRRQRQITWLMEVVLIGLFFIGLERRNLGIIVNTGIALGVTQIVPLLERDHNIPMDAGLTLWITAAVFLHALGTVGLPGGELSFYRSVPGWDHLTHVLSSSVVAAVGYATTLALDRHVDGIDLPPKFMFAFILLFVMAFGVFWEVIEFGLAGLAALAGTDTVLTQYGLRDTMFDLIFDLLGGVIVAVWGTAYLTNLVQALTLRLEQRSGRAD